MRNFNSLNTIVLLVVGVFLLVVSFSSSSSSFLYSSRAFFFILVRGGICATETQIVNHSPFSCTPFNTDFKKNRLVKVLPINNRGIKLLSGMLVQRMRFTAVGQYWSRGCQTLELNRFPGA